MHPYIMAIVDELAPETPPDVVFASVLLVCSETGLALPVALAEARAAVARHHENRRLTGHPRPPGDGVIVTEGKDTTQA